MKYFDKHTRKYREKKDQQFELYTSDRIEKRKRKRELQKFCISNIDDKPWWYSLTLEDQCEIHNRYKLNWASWAYDNCITFEIESFFKEVKLEFPGDLGKKRDIVLNKLLK